MNTLKAMAAGFGAGALISVPAAVLEPQLSPPHSAESITDCNTHIQELARDLGDKTLQMTKVPADCQPFVGNVINKVGHAPGGGAPETTSYELDKPQRFVQTARNLNAEIKERNRTVQSILLIGGLAAGTGGGYVLVRRRDTSAPVPTPTSIHL